MFQLEDIKTEQQRDEFLSQHGDRLIDLGINCYKRSDDWKNDLAYMVKKFYLFYR